MADNRKFKNNNSNTGGVTEDGFLRISLVNQGVFVRKKKVCPLKNISIEEIESSEDSLNFDTWRERYNPIKNPKIEDKDWYRDDEVELYTFDIDELNPEWEKSRVWTLLLGDFGEYIVPGIHRVNREGYLYTQTPVLEEDLEAEFEV